MRHRTKKRAKEKRNQRKYRKPRHTVDRGRWFDIVLDGISGRYASTWPTNDA